MEFDLSIDTETQFVRVTVSGLPTFSQLVSMIHLLGVESDGWRHGCVLVDLRRVATRFSLAEQHRIGEEAATSLHHMEKIASVVPAQRVTRVSEKAARRSGTNVRVFDDERQAVEWLEGHSEPA